MHQAALQESGCLCTELSVTDDDTATDDRVRGCVCATATEHDDMSPFAASHNPIITVTSNPSLFIQVSELWCQRNSARMLCAIHGLCGVWDCPIEDFMCPRYEYNREFVDGRPTSRACVRV